MSMHWRSRFQRQHFRLLFAVSVWVLGGLGLTQVQFTFWFGLSPHGGDSDVD
jgi:hypothetical protein